MFQFVFFLGRMSLKLVAFLFVIAKVGAYRLQIINGKATDVQTTPYQLVFLYNDRFVCGAAIISENYALTAGRIALDSFT